MALNILCAFNVVCLLWEIDARQFMIMNRRRYQIEFEVLRTSKILSDNVLKYEMKVNYRQSSELQKVSTRMRNALVQKRQ